MDQRLEQFQKEMQDQLQQQMNKQLEKIQQKMMDKIMEYQGSMMDKLTQLLTGGVDKGKGFVLNIEEGDSKGLVYPSGSTPQHVEVYPRRSSITIKSQQLQANASIPTKFQVGSGSNLGDNLINPTVPDFDEMAGREKMKDESSKQLEAKYKWLEEKSRAMENTESYYGVDAKELNLVPDLVLPYKFKMPEFEKYNGTSSPKAHITMFCRRMSGYVNNDQLLIHCFQDSLVGAASKWYNQLSRTMIGSWRDLAQAFIKQYSHVTNMVPDRITLQNLEKNQMKALGSTHKGGGRSPSKFSHRSWKRK
ncbi:uncharacterized protein LOC105783926 [Gossypium raimondii]|uniref:uncharacterized protein LOC105783926 n=1 Tax=Gossypium raimondii TaxID=29730 RepID=UPI00227B6717|nr:uncharacterized protein LOC105783926 [Gossypium raimondii]